MSENKLLHLDVSKSVEKKSGLSYLSWTYAWTEILKAHPNTTYKVLKFENNLPYVYDPSTGYMVFTEVTIDGLTREMWLFVMDGANKAMKAEPYTYKVKDWNASKAQNTTVMKEKNVDVASMFDINKTIMRCLVKNLAMFGLGLYIYAGEDLPEEPEDQIKEREEAELKAKEALKLKLAKELEILLKKALAEVIECNTTDELTKLWGNNKIHQKNNLFIKSVAEAGEKLKELNTNK